MALKQPSLDKSANGALYGLPVADLAGEFGDRAPVRIRSQRERQDRPLNGHIRPKAGRHTICLHGKPRLPVPGGGLLAQRPRRFLSVDETKLDQEIARIYGDFKLTHYLGSDSELRRDEPEQRGDHDAAEPEKEML